MVSGRRQAVDSALIKANASMDSIAEKEIMHDADAFTDELNSNEGEEQPKVNAYKKKKVEEHHRWKQKAYQGQPASRVKQNPDVAEDNTDKDARIAVKPGKPRQFNYLAQTSVDTEHHVITHRNAD